MQSRQIYDVIIFVHQTEIRPFLSAVHVGPEVSAVQCGVASNNDSPLLWLAFKVIIDKSRGAMSLFGQDKIENVSKPIKCFKCFLKILYIFDTSKCATNHRDFLRFHRSKDVEAMKAGKSAI